MLAVQSQSIKQSTSAVQALVDTMKVSPTTQVLMGTEQRLRTAIEPMFTPEDWKYNDLLWREYSEDEFNYRHFSKDSFLLNLSWTTLVRINSTRLHAVLTDHTVGTKAYRFAGVLFIKVPVCVDRVWTHQLLIMREDSLCQTVQLLSRLAQGTLAISLGRATSHSKEGKEAVMLCVVNTIRRMWQGQVTYKHFSAPVRALHVMRQGIFQMAPENGTTFRETCCARAANIIEKCIDIYPEYLDMWKPFEDTMMLHNYSWLKVLDLAKMHHCSIASDTSLNEGLDGIEEILAETPPSKPEVLQELNAFGQARDVANFHQRFKELPKMGGEDPPTKWVNQLQRGVYDPPDKESWGKFWIEGDYKYRSTLDEHTLTPKDATSVSETMRINNQLVNALVRGPVLENGRLPSDMRLRAKESDHLLYVAAKAESAKIKKRMTATPSDMMRLVFSEAEKLADTRNLCNKTVSTSMPAAQLRNKFCAMTVVEPPCKEYTEVVTSHDISGWSQHQDRQHVYNTMRRNEKAFDLEEKEVPPLIDSLQEMYDESYLVHMRGGRAFKAKCVRHGIQGLPGKTDSSHHSDLGEMWYYNNQQYLFGKAPTISLYQIDDVMAKLRVRGSGETAVKYLEAALKALDQAYVDAGYQLDPIKSIIGENKFVFLNEEFIDGIYVAASFKVSQKSAYSPSTQIRSVTRELHSVCTAAATAIRNGGDVFPIAFAAYFTCAWKIYRDFKNITLGPLEQDVTGGKLAAVLTMPNPGLGILPLVAIASHGSGSTYINATDAIQKYLRLLLLATNSKQPITVTPIGVNQDFLRYVEWWAALPHRPLTPLQALTSSCILTKAFRSDTTTVIREAIARALKEWRGFGRAVRNDAVVGRTRRCCESIG